MFLLPFYNLKPPKEIANEISIYLKMELWEVKITGFGLTPHGYDNLLQYWSSKDSNSVLFLTLILLAYIF